MLRFYFYALKVDIQLDFNFFPLDGLGAGAIEFIICHAEVALAFVEEKKISEVQLFIKEYMSPFEFVLYVWNFLQLLFF